MWWRDAVVYEIYLRSFADSDGDGVGDLAGVRAHLPYIADLGVDAIWLTPFYPSPMHDHGYDVANYVDVDPLFGSLADVDAVLADAHALGLHVFVDIVPNHTSNEHPWFRRAIADPHAPERDRYIFRPGRGAGPPNDWQSVFGGSAWTQDPATGDYYLHLFDDSQPDLNWRNPEVHDFFRDVLRFWLDRGVDGFRIDVAHGVYKDPKFRDGKANAWDQDEVFGVWQEWRQVIDEYDDRSFVGEVFLYDMDRVAQYVGADRLHQAFNFVMAKIPFTANDFRTTIRRALELFERADTSPTWVLSNHDLVRHPTRFGGGRLGLRRGAAATALLLALPGSPYLYQGEELGLEETVVPPAARQDPVWRRGGGIGRDGCRTPVPWTSEAPGFGFTTGTPWLPFDRFAAKRSIAAELADPESGPLQLYRRMLALRRELLPQLSREVSWPRAPEECVAIRRKRGDRGWFVAIMNAGDEPSTVTLPGDGALLLSTSGGAAAAAGQVVVPAETTVWICDRNSPSVASAGDNSSASR